MGGGGVWETGRGGYINRIGTVGSVAAEHIYGLTTGPAEVKFLPSVTSLVFCHSNHLGVKYICVAIILLFQGMGFSLGCTWVQCYVLYRTGT